MEEDYYDLRLNLVKAIRMLDNIEQLDMNGHVSCRLPDRDAFLINCRQASRVSIKIDDIVLCNFEGELIQGSFEPPSEVYIHAKIYQARPDVFAVIHNHPHWQTVLGIAGIQAKPVFAIGATIDELEIYENSSLINTPIIGEEVAKALKGKMAIHLRHHGNVVVGEDLKSVFVRAVIMEENAKKQYLAALINPDYHVLEGENLIRTRETSWSNSIIEKLWSYYENKSARDGALDSLGI